LNLTFKYRLHNEGGGGGGGGGGGAGDLIEKTVEHHMNDRGEEEEEEEQENEDTKTMENSSIAKILVNLRDYNVPEEDWTEWGPLDWPSRNLRTDTVCRCGKIGEFLVEFRNGPEGYQQERRHFFDDKEARKRYEQSLKDVGTKDFDQMDK